MKARFILSTILMAFSFAVQAANISGFVTDKETQEPLIGATVQLVGTSYYAIVGLDGSYSVRNLPEGTYEVEVSFVGYQKIRETFSVNGQNMKRDFLMALDNNDLAEVVVSGSAIKGSEMQARTLERNAANTINVISKKAIELSPDITVANIVQRVSGLSVERNASGDPQHAIVRGMDKRYNYTLVNGVKIPSPDNQNRFIPLDIFPAQLLERLEVSKSLTPMMEGDAIGGAVNMVMKDAPEEFMLEGDIQLGYNQINLDRGFYHYDRSDLNMNSPYQQFGADYAASMGDFTTSNMMLRNKTPMPDILGSLTYGDRFLNDRLGVMLGGSFQNSYRGSDSNWYRADVDNFGSGRPTLTRLQERVSSTQQQRAAFHSKVDYVFNPQHKLYVYAGNYFLNDFRVREMLDTDVDGRNYNYLGGTGILTHITRFTSRYQNIQTSTLGGEHSFGSRGRFTMDWSGVYSLAASESPDDGIFKRNGEMRDFEFQPQNIERRNFRQWLNNTDRDLTAFLNFSYAPGIINDETRIQFGGMYRDKDRNSFFNRYIFDPTSPAFQVEGVHWDTFEDVSWALLNPRGNTSDPLNFDSYEKIAAGYINTKWDVFNTEINAGVRVEHTDQGYTLAVASQSVNPDSSQTYIDVLPSVSFKHRLNSKMNLRGSYYKALSRPGFHEIVPYRMAEEDGFDERGNPNLQRVRAHNYDVRYEFFPTLSEQVLVGAFVKDLRDPIEYTLARTNIFTGPLSLQPTNFGNAVNWGLEADFIKYYNKIGIRFNYTYTNSRITTSKIERRRENPDDPSSQLVQVSVDQTRPLQGQADHIGNLSLMYKDQVLGLDAQISAVYTGERIEFVSPFLNNDHWSRPITQLDLSVDKNIGKSLTVFVRVNNILDTPYELFVKSPLAREDAVFPYQNNVNETVVRSDRFGQSYRLGLRFRLNQ
ncbi:TonB-dependent receptor [Litoribacter alkaliphilus]|uniref:TonB-dependent receptor n=2 Tax=Litoribacter ruber TaxID=702568 RepID=A0AAP2CFV3_9BACT|nr:TonB-dependent receptor [Litoribacter alkaliphilus]